MGGIRVDPDSQMSTVAGLFAAGECAAGLHGANRLGGNSLSDLLVFGKRAGEYAARFATEHGPVAVDDRQVDAASRRALAPLERAESTDGAAPYQVQHELQGMMQELVGIVRTGPEIARALEGLASLRARAERVGVTGNREYNPGWHTALDLRHMLIVSEAIARSALERQESRGAHFRDDYPAKDEALGKVRMVTKRGADGAMDLTRVPVPAIPAELQRVIEEMK
jgi:succinate dehydrogenase / fumarate reductase flavoprotein subunit